MEPLLLDLPPQIETDRLVLRPPAAGDGAVVNEAVLETIESLQPWMPWSVPTPTAEQTELWVRKSASDFLARRQLPLLLFHKADGTFVCSSGIHRIDWAVPKVEIGYWVRKRFEGQGYVAEAVAAITQLAFETLGAKRVEIRTDDRNQRSWRVAERLGFKLEGILRNECRDANGLRDTRIYAVTGPLP